MAKKRLFPIHLAPMDAFFMADDGERYPMTFVIELELSSALDQKTFEQALETARERQPLLSAFVRPAKRGLPCWVSAGDAKPMLDWQVGDALPTLAAEETLDLSSEIGLRVWVREQTNRTTITMQFHHACCDGTGAYRFIGDCLALYDAAIHGTEAKLHPLDPSMLKTRLGKMADLVLRGTKREIRKLALNEAFHLFLKSHRKLNPPSGRRAAKNRLTTFPGFVSRGLTAKEHKQLRQVAGEFGLTMNDLLICELLCTLNDWTAKHGSKRGKLQVMVPTDMREAEDYAMPATNLTSYTFVRRSPKDCADAAALRDSVRQETIRIKNERLGTRFVDMVLVTMQFKKLLQRGIAATRWKCLSTACLSNAGDPSRRFTAEVVRKNRLVRVGNALLEKITGVPPIRSGTGATISISSYGRALTISSRCDPYRFDAAENIMFVESYLDHLRQYIQTPDIQTPDNT